MQVQLLRPAPYMEADKGDIVDLPEWQANNWISRGTAAPVGSDEAMEAAEEAEAAEAASATEEEEEDGAGDDESEIDLSELSEDGSEEE